LILTFPTGGACPSGGNYTTTVEIDCNHDQYFTKIKDVGHLDEKKCHNYLKLISKYACRTTKFFAWYKSLGISKYIVGSVLGLVGLFLVFFGNTFPEATSFGIIAFSTAIILKSLFGPIYKMDFIIALILGCLIAYFVTKNMGAIKTVLGIVIGFFLGNILYNFIVKIFTNVDPDTLFLITILVCIGLVFLFSYAIESLILIVATTLIGSYCAIRGLSICLGGFPDETYTSKLIQYKEFNQLGRVFNGKANLYLMGILLLFLVGLIVQGSVACLTGGEPKIDDPTPVAQKDNDQEHLNKPDTNEVKVEVETKNNENHVPENKNS
jgi:hypothetical protein